jgi:glyoxylase-like metal-dependent hydrolase (beta-lactamase superfamily II)
MERTLFGKQARFEGGLHEVAAGVLAWMQPNGDWGESNAGLVVGDGEALLVDTLWDLRLTRRMLDAIRARLEVPIRTLVNTHSDGDHVWGNQLVEDAEIIATRAAARIIREEPSSALQRFQALAPQLRRLGGLPLPVVGRLAIPGLPRVPVGELGAYIERMLAPFDYSGVHVTAPTREFSGELTIEVGGRRIDLIEVGPAHTAGDLIVHVPDASVVFAADVMFVGVVPAMWAGPIGNWIRALERILELEPAVIVPGHGPLSGADEVRALLGYLAWLDAAAGGRLAAGRSVADTARELALSDEYRSAAWADWDSPERIVITVAAIDRHRRAAGPVGARGRAAIFAQVAALAAELRERR